MVIFHSYVSLPEGIRSDWENLQEALYLPANNHAFDALLHVFCR